jgi:hypothetical protein
MSLLILFSIYLPDAVQNLNFNVSTEEPRSSNKLENNITNIVTVSANDEQQVPKTERHLQLMTPT